MGKASGYCSECRHSKAKLILEAPNTISRAGDNHEKLLAPLKKADLKNVPRGPILEV
jgi:hypothetical protein